MEASTLQRSASLGRPRVALGSPLLRLRSDEQLVELFRAGSEEAFRVIHDRYNKRLFAYARQMLPGRQDAEDALQDVFVRAYSGLRSSDRELALRAWLFRIAHNRCVDELRKPSPPPPEVLHLVRSTVHDPLVELDLRESLRRLVQDIRRLPDQQRSALLMRELGGMSYAELSGSLGISVGAIKPLLVRARIALAEAAEARDTACAVIREQLVDAHDRGVRPNANARKHIRDCVGCKAFRRELRGVSRQLAAMTPALGPLGVLAKLLGISGGAGGGAGGGAALVGGSGATASVGGVALGANHVATLLIAAVATAGGAVEIQGTILPQAHPATRHATAVQRIHRTDADAALPYQAAQDVATHGTPAVITASAPAAAKPAASATGAAATTTKLRHTRHARDAARLKKANAKVRAGGVAVGVGLPSSATTIPSITTTTGAGLSASCPAPATAGAPGGHGSTPPSATATGNGASAPTDGTTGTSTSTASTSCQSAAGGSSQAPASPNGSATPAGSPTPSSAAGTSTGAGSPVATGAGSTTATGAGSAGATGSASTGATGQSSTAATGSGVGASASGGTSGATIG